MKELVQTSQFLSCFVVGSPLIEGVKLRMTVSIVYSKEQDTIFDFSKGPVAIAWGHTSARHSQYP